MRYKYNLEELEKMVKSSLSISEVCRKMNIRPSGGNYKTINKKIREYDIDTSHFTGSAWNVGKRFKPFGNKYNLEDVLIENSPYCNTTKLKKRLYESGIKKEECEKCHIVDWNGIKIVFDLDHINGVNDDNRIENLQILCPNCHSQTINYKGKNKLNAKLNKQLS